ncbi:MAG: HAMP domain-containing sensor histidine kinase [Bdellovibrionota bacterium]
MSGLDSLFLGGMYELRGPRPLPDKIQVYQIAPSQIAELLPKLLESLQPSECLLVNLPTGEPQYCHTLEINNFYALSSFMDLQTPFKVWFAPNTTIHPETYMPYYYGPQNSIPRFSPKSVLPPNPISQDKILVLLPTEPVPPFSFDTPSGHLSSFGVLLNVLGNFKENRSLNSASYLSQILITLALVSLFMLFIYRFPIWLSGLVLLGSGLFYFVLSLIFFDQMRFVLPLAAPLIGLGLSYVLGMADQLERREKNQWALERETEFLRELDDLKNHFLSLVSHDLKTPIARIQSLLEQLADVGKVSHLDPEQNQLVRKALSANSQLQRSIATLLLLNRIESRDFRIQKKPTDLVKLVEESLKSLRDHASERNVSITTELEPLFLLDLDATLIREVIHNLVDNALKYSDSDSQILIRCGEADLLSELTPPQPGVWFEVQDFGGGIDPQDRSKVMQRFFSTDSKKIPHDQPIKGTGLGLYLSAFFAEKHSGRITILSRCAGEKVSAEDPVQEYFPEGTHGTVVRVALPLESL